MRFLLIALILVSVPPTGTTQGIDKDAAILKQARSKYDNPFDRGLQSFDCAVDFDWKQHWKETARVGDEGTDEEIAASTQSLHNRVLVTHSDAVVSSGLTEEQEQKLPRAGMAEGLLQHAVRLSLRNWLGAGRSLLPPIGTPIRTTSVPSGFELSAHLQQFDVDWRLSTDMALESIGVHGSYSDRQAFSFEPGDHGFLVRSWIMGESGNFKPGNRLMFEYTYQTVDGFKIPKTMAVIRESHHDTWRYSLSQCKVTTT